MCRYLNRRRGIDPIFYLYGQRLLLNLGLPWFVEPKPPYYQCDKRDNLLEELKMFANHKGSALLEIRTNGELNQKQLKHYFKSIAKGEELKIKDN